MKYLIFYLPVTLLVFYLTFVYFCAVMKLRSARESGYLKDAPFIVKAFAWITLIVGLLLDSLLNVLLSVILMEPPREFLTTFRMIRLKKEGNDWQKSVARWMCKQLDNLDEHHCG